MRKGEMDTGRKLEGTVSPLMDNDSSKAQIIDRTTASTMLKPPWGLEREKQTENKVER